MTVGHSIYQKQMSEIDGCEFDFDIFGNIGLVEPERQQFSVGMHQAYHSQADVFQNGANANELLFGKYGLAFKKRTSYEMAAVFD
jgi:hypothetical protein